MKIYIAYYAPVYDGDSGYYVDWSNKKIIKAFTTFELLKEKIHNEILKLDGHFFTPDEQMIRYKHPSENVFHFGDNHDSTYMCGSQVVDLITELDIFK